jgi:uncharacterized membrane-anchored protein YhcB (DUF1043 family)
MNLIPTWPIAAGALVIGLGVGASIDNFVMDAKLSRKEAEIEKVKREEAERVQTQLNTYADDSLKARQREQLLQATLGNQLQDLTNEKDRIATRLADATRRLQQRPDRLPATAQAGGAGAAPAACQGTTGAQLSRPDAEFLEREAARAEQLRAALSACYQAYDAAAAALRPAQ